jgi:iron complex transport system substrate-binding protein
MRWLLLATILVVPLVACGRTASPPADPDANSLAVTPPVTSESGAGSSYPLTVQGSDGRSLTLASPARRIVSLSAGTTEVFFAIGAGGQLVGTDRFSDFPAEARTLPKVEYSNPSAEAITALQPDLVVAAGRQRALVPVLAQVGLPVLLLDEPASLSELLARVRLQGQLTGRVTEADALAQRLQQRIEHITALVETVSAGPRVYHELSPRLVSAGPASFVGDLYTRLGAQNIVQDTSAPYPQLNAETIIRADPEVIVLAAASSPGGSPAEVRQRPGWRAITAVREQRLVVIDADLVSRPGPRIVDGLEQLARALYPGLFP